MVSELFKLELLFRSGFPKSWTMVLHLSTNFLGLIYTAYESWTQLGLSHTTQFKKAVKGSVMRIWRTKTIQCARPELRNYLMFQRVRTPRFLNSVTTDCHGRMINDEQLGV